MYNFLVINGEENMTITYIDEYVDQGAYFKTYTRDLSKRIEIENNVISHQIGEYEVVYKIDYFFKNIKKKRIVRIVDEKSPVIELTGESNVTICPNSNYIEDGYKAYDEYDGDLTDAVEVSRIGDTIVYKVKDSSNNEFSIGRMITKADNERPKITLNGSNNVYVNLNNQYDELGYSVSDNCDKNISVSVKSNLDTTREGVYQITYTAVDSSGNSSSVSRNINVYKDNKRGVIYLTFDDGPSGSGSTAKILDVLKKEDVKATFFVTCGGPDSLILREFNEGHKIALHTKTHNYRVIYKSVDNYFKDLEAVKKRVYDLTGYSATIIRFPGGSNNTVSNNYNRGIMRTLRSEVLNKGYTYFDWNVSADDAAGCTNSTCVYNNVIKGLSKSKTNVVLIHDIKSYSADALEKIIQYGKNNNYEFKVIDEYTPVVKFA